MLPSFVMRSLFVALNAQLLKELPTFRCDLLKGAAKAQFGSALDRIVAIVVLRDMSAGWCITERFHRLHKKNISYAKDKLNTATSYHR